MRRRRHLIAVILVYVAFDLCLASIPGAFVFDANDSVEGTVMNRARPGALPVLASPEPSGTPWASINAVALEPGRVARDRPRLPQSRPRRSTPDADAADPPPASDTPH